ncbi:ribosome-associated protein [Lachnospiraceae bacterium C7]|nr:ribosome-associated protein [Lachnospiraceae bacterium C7]
METLDIVKKIATVLDEKKAIDVKVLDIMKVSTIADYFVLASGSNSNQLQAMVDIVEDEMVKCDVHSKRVEGDSSSSWILMDFGDVVVHLFSDEDREFYDLDRIWSDGEVVEY